MSVFIIAEAGVNHNGDIALAKKMIEVAVDAGADAIKFQTFNAQALVSRNAQKADYQKQTTDEHESQFEMIKKLELDVYAHQVLLEHCQARGITFLSTPFDSESIDLLDRLGMERFKIPSGEITNLPHLRAIGSLRKEVILSTGMAKLGEIESAIETLVTAGTTKDRITVLHANTMYPTPFEDVNLRAMVTIGSAFGCHFGYSDHTLGIEVPIAAVALGAGCIEKHFTLDRSMEGPDHRASLEPHELKSMVSSVRHVEKALGSHIKAPSPSEQPNISIARKSIVAACPIKEGTLFSEANLTVKRPGTGISPMRWDEIIGSKAQKNYETDGLI